MVHFGVFWKALLTTHSSSTCNIRPWTLLLQLFMHNMSMSNCRFTAHPTTHTPKNLRVCANLWVVLFEAGAGGGADPPLMHCRPIPKPLEQRPWRYLYSTQDWFGRGCRKCYCHKRVNYDVNEKIIQKQSVFITRLTFVAVTVIVAAASSIWMLTTWSVDKLMTNDNNKMSVNFFTFLLVTSCNYPSSGRSSRCSAPAAPRLVTRAVITRRPDGVS